MIFDGLIEDTKQIETTIKKQQQKKQEHREQRIQY